MRTETTIHATLRFSGRPPADEFERAIVRIALIGEAIRLGLSNRDMVAVFDDGSSLTWEELS